MKPESPGPTGKARETLAKVLDHVLRDEDSLSALIRDYRRKLIGPNLYSLHRLFDEQRRQLDAWRDQLIDRARSIGFGGRTTGVTTAAEAQSRVSGPGLPADTIIGDLLARHEGLARQLREELARLGDPVTAEVLRRLLEFHETAAWMLRMLHGDRGSGKSA